MRSAFLLAHPAGHSISPAIHNAAFRHYELAARYEAWDVPPASLGEAISRLRRDDCLGANVTIPHKEGALDLIDVVTEEPMVIGAVNTIVNHGGVLHGHNTDAGGFVRSLDEAGVEVKGQLAVVLGAGGAARAVTYALLRAGASVAVHNRSEDKGRRLTSELGEFGEVRFADAAALLETVFAAELLVNATSVGMHGGPGEQTSPLPEGVMPQRGVVCDLVYRPRQTVLLKEARQAGLRVIDGLPMLIYQGAAAFELWTLLPAPVEVMARAAERALDA